MPVPAVRTFGLIGLVNDAGQVPEEGEREVAEVIGCYPVGLCGVDTFERHAGFLVDDGLGGRIMASLGVEVELRVTTFHIRYNKTLQIFIWNMVCSTGRHPLSSGELINRN